MYNMHLVCIYEISPCSSIFQISLSTSNQPFFIEAIHLGGGSVSSGRMWTV